MQYIKRLAVTLLTLLLVLSLPAGAVASAADDTADPGGGRLSGDIPAEFYDDSSTEPRLGAGVGTTSTSPFTNAIYTHTNGHENLAVLHGIDVSTYQSEIDWNKVSAAGVDYVILRVGYRGYGSAGTLVEDNCFVKHITNASAAGIPVGVYIYSQAITTAEAVEEAQFVLDRIKGYNIKLPVVLDYEYASVGGASGGRLYNANLTVDAATAICNAFSARVSLAGYEPMVYANKSMLTNKLNNISISSNAKVWLAHYTTATSYTGEYDFWQYTSQGTVDGIPGSVGHIDCNFWYIEIPATAINIPANSVDINLGVSQKLQVNLTPYNATTPVRWTSSNNTVVTIDSQGVLHPVSVGTAMVTGHAGSISDSCEVTVSYPPVSGAQISQTTLRLEEGKNTTLAASALPEFAQNRSVTWSSSDSTIARVSANGTVSAIKPGAATITATTVDGGFTASCEVTVGASVSSISLSASTITVNRGQSQTLKATVLPAAAASFWDVIYASENTSVATVSDKGTITAVGIGATVITATAGGKAAKCTVNVPAQLVDVEIDVTLPYVTTAAYKNITAALTNTAGVTTSGVSAWNAVGATLNVRVLEGQYVLRITKPGFLSYTDKTYTIGYGSNKQPALIAGDLNGDGYINAKDTGAMADSIDGTIGVIGGVNHADFNNDSKVDTVDMATLVSNFGKTETIID